MKVVAGLALALLSAPALAQAPATPSAAPVVKEKDAQTMPVALWAENGEPKVARGAEAVKTAPKDAVTVQVKVWPLGGPAFREATFPKGANFLPPKGPTDTLVYMVKGRMKVSLGDVTAEVGPGDAFRKMGDQRNTYQVIEETVILETDYTRPAAK